MKKRAALILFYALLTILFSSCNGTSTPSAEDIATAIAGTQQALEMQSVFETATELSRATDTAEPTSTDTPVPSDTPKPSATSTFAPPEGMVYVPDFIGMTWVEVEQLFRELGLKKAYYVAAIKRDVPEWTVFQQEPEPGTLVEIPDGRVKVVVAVYEFTPTPTSEPRSGQNFSDNCGGVTYQGFCYDPWNVVWCENNQLWIWDCAAYCGGTCGWYNASVGYTCMCP